MIINNHINTLPENKETKLTFTSFAIPVLNIRMFNHNLIQGETHLVIPYYVSDYSHKEYTNEKLGPTFTTIVTVDEDTVPADQVKTWKKTTYAGEQSIDLGVFNDLGPHTFNIRTIQNNGIGSITKLLKFIVRKPEAQQTVIDLSNGGSFQSVFDGHSRYTFTCEEHKVIREDYNCSYSVSCIMDGATVTGIDIVVSKLQNKDCYQARNVRDYSGELGTSYNKVINFDGVHHLATTCIVDGSVVNLTDYLSTSMGNLPRIVIETAAKNKVALTRLFEAAKAAGADRIILPKLDIVCDYHYALDYSTDPSISIDISGSLQNKTETRDGIVIPDGLWVNLNQSKVTVLQTTNNEAAKLFSVEYRVDSHLINGKICGNWIGCSHSKSGDGEHRSILAIQGSQFCSFENLDISGTVGYDVMISAFDGSHFAGNRQLFDTAGFIDYDGEEHDLDTVGSSNPYTGFVYTSQMGTVSDAQWLVDHHVFRPSNYDDNSFHIEDIHSLTCKIVFVSFYDENRKFIKTVKTSERLPTLAPYGAVYAKLCKHGTTRLGEYDSLNYSDSGKFGFCYRVIIGWANSIIGCNIANTRQTVFVNGSAQVTVKDCKLFGVNGERSSHYNWGLDEYNNLVVAAEYASVIRTRNELPDPKYGYDFYSIYPTLVTDIEDESRQSYYNFWDNVELVYGKVNTMKIDGTVDAHFKNCRNLYVAFGDYNIDCLIENCYISLYTSYGWWSTNSWFIIRNSIIESIDHCAYRASNRGCFLGYLYTRNCDLRLIGTDGRFNDRIQDYQKLKI